MMIPKICVLSCGQQEPPNLVAKRLVKSDSQYGNRLNTSARTAFLCPV